jgi:hypothetical protein
MNTKQTYKMYFRAARKGDSIHNGFSRFSLPAARTLASRNYRDPLTETSVRDRLEQKRQLASIFGA